MGARRPKPTALKERTSVRPQLGLSRLFSAANALVPFHKHEETQEIVRDLKLAPQSVESDDKTLKLGDPRLAQPLELAQVPVAKPLLDPNKRLDPLPQFDKEVFARAQDPVKDSAYEPSKSLKDPADDEYGTVVRVANKKRNKPKLEDTNVQSIEARTSITKLKKQEEKKKESNGKLQALFLLVPAIGLATYALLGSDMFAPSQPVARKSALTPDQIQERLEYYRHITGSKLNRDRINVQIQNFKQAPELSATDHNVKPPNMMDGLPLSGEANNFSRNPKGDLPYDPTYSEAKIGYGLQEEQDRQIFEKQAREAWVQEFVENARKDGYDVKIDKFGNVKAKPIPAEERGPLPDD